MPGVIAPNTKPSAAITLASSRTIHHRPNASAAPQSISLPAVISGRFDQARDAGAVRADLDVNDIPMIFEQLAAIRLGDERVDAERRVGPFVAGGEPRAGVLRAEEVPPHLGDPERV